MKTFPRAARLSRLSLALLLLGGAGPAWAKHKHAVDVVEGYTSDGSITKTDATSVPPVGSASGGTLTLGSGINYPTSTNAGTLTAASVVNTYDLGVSTYTNAGTLTLVGAGTLISGNSLNSYNLASATSINAGTLSAINFNGGSTSGATTTLTFTNGQYSLVPAGSLTKNGANTLTLNARSSLGNAWSTGMAELSGSAGELKITTAGGGSTLRVKTTVSVSNTGTKAAKNVTADVYLSDDAVLDADDTKLTTLKLADFFPGTTKLGKNQTLSLPIKHKVPTALAAFLDGKYLIVGLNSDSGRTASTSSVQTATSSEAVAASDANGAVSGVTITNPGVGYTTAPTVVITGVPAVDFSTSHASAGAVTINAGTLVLTNAAGYRLPDLTVTEANTFRLDPAVVQATGAASLPGGTLQIAATGALVPCATGVTLSAQPGDILTITAGNSLTAVSAGAWEIPTGQKVAISSGATLTTLAASPAVTTPTTPKNEVIIGPIKLP